IAPANTMRPIGVSALLLDGFDGDGDLDVVADHRAAGLDRAVPVDAEVLPADGRRRVGDYSQIALCVLDRRRRRLHAQDDLFRHIANREVADELESFAGDVLHSPGLERHRGELPGVEEAVPAQVLVPTADVRVDALRVDVDVRLDRARITRLVLDGAPRPLEHAADARQHHVTDGE